ncbi:MAG: alpha/beta fold hydrolase [Chloroflexi bacterium]|nr:alpha/beta fold hydrolase [Chloroflexota bacterium]
MAKKSTLVQSGVILLIIVMLHRAWRAAGQLIYPARRSAGSTPATYGLTAEAISFRTHDGLTLRGWWVPTSFPAKGTVVFSHGYAGDCSPDLVYVPLFNRAGYNICLFDYRGHGASDGRFTSLVYFERRDLLAALDFLRARGIERVGLMGFSMGGAIALAVAAQSPMVVGVVSDCSFGAIHRIIANAARQRGAPEPFATVIGWLVELMASVRLRANLFSADPIHSIARIAPRPVLIMHGEADEAIPCSQARQLFETARQPKELWLVPHAGHRRIEDVAPAEYRQRVIEFFDRAFSASQLATKGGASTVFSKQFPQCESRNSR